ncbi:hypothetical protein D3C80_1948420 [compost metagenome]
MPLTLAESQTQQTHEYRQIVATTRLHGQRLVDQQLEQFLKAGFCLLLGLTSIQLAIEAAAKRTEKTRKNRLNQCFFRTKMIIHRCQIDPSLTGNQAQ